MSENRPINEVAVDRRDETVVTQQPGYAATEQVTRDVVADFSGCAGSVSNGPAITGVTGVVSGWGAANR